MVPLDCSHFACVSFDHSKSDLVYLFPVRSTSSLFSIGSGFGCEFVRNGAVFGWTTDFFPLLLSNHISALQLQTVHAILHLLSLALTFRDRKSVV